MAIHSTAIIEPGAKLGAGVEVGAYAFIGSGVELGDRCRVGHHASIDGLTKAGAANHFFPFVSIGQKSQDLKYTGEPTYLEIGSNNVFREFVTINRATKIEEKTIIGSYNLFLTYSHVAHDCVVGSHTIFSNNATLAGHVIVEDHAIVGGLSAVHQFCRIGQHAMIGGCAKIVQDVPPYFVADGNPAEVRAVNVVGLQRRNFSEATIKAIRQAFKILYDTTLNTSQAVEKLEAELGSCPEVKNLIEFVRKSQRGIIR